MFDGLRGKFIVFDGTEGCGKSTQARLLRSGSRATRTASPDADVLLVRDPGTTRIGEQVRAILLDPANAEMAHALRDAALHGRPSPDDGRDHRCRPCRPASSSSATGSSPARSRTSSAATG